MDEIRRALDREARRVHADPDALEDVRRRARRRSVRRRAVTTVLVVGITGATFALAYGALRPTTRTFPAAGPTPTTETTSRSAAATPARTLGIEVYDAAPGLSMQELDSYLELLIGSSAPPYTIVAIRETEGSEVTVLMHRPDHDHWADDLREQWFPYAQQRIDPDLPAPVRIVIGEDFERREAVQIRNAQTAYTFLRGRVQEEPERVEPLLSEAAAEMFERGENGLDLYSYAAHAVFDIVLIDRRPDETTFVHLLMLQTNEGGQTEVLETLTVGDEDGDGRPEILSAERNR